MNVSKELLSEVLNINNKVSWYFEIRGNTLFWDGDYNLNGNINIYELQHLCKEWARANNRLLTTIYYKDSVLVYINFRHTLDLSASSKGGNIIGYDGLIRCDTEPEAVIKAAQWILDNKDKQ